MPDEKLCSSAQESLMVEDNKSSREEMLEIVDEEGRVIGLEPRSSCHGDPSLTHRAVHVFVRDRSGRLFLQKRAKTKKIQPGKWDTSVGGHLDPGESYEQAAERELHEELGVRLQQIASPGGLVRKHDYVWRSPVETELVRTFEITYDGPFRLHPEELEDGRFWTEAELREACGTGVLTPNLEEELSRLGVISRERI
jgi:isopentenyl-diphosphate delta-isomerase type 1